MQIHDHEEELSWLSQLKHLSRQMHPQAGSMWPVPHNFSMLSQLTSLECTVVHLRPETEAKAPTNPKKLLGPASRQRCGIMPAG